MGVFISYNKADREVAREIALFLAAEGINVWFDEWEISAGDSITQEISAGLSRCTHFLIIWSQNSATSNWVNRELYSILSSAISNGIPKIIPVILDQEPLPKLISDLKYIRYHGGTETDRKDIIQVVTGNAPTKDFIRAIVKKYHELVRDNAGATGVFVCPECGNSRINGNTYSSDDGDMAILVYKCSECGWEETHQL